jgi:pantoate--beta-alanine ligase
MQTKTKIKDLRAALSTDRQSGKRIAFVPTMGNLHSGHISLVERAKEVADIVVVSIFVNPLQFGVNEDLASYPRTLDADKAKLVDAGTSYLFYPEVDEMYPQGMSLQTQVSVPGITELHCGASRPGHFTGVATVVSKLFNMVQPDIALFGQKDFQQLAVIRKMVDDMCIPIDIIGVPTARASDGLALSSRNGYLSKEQRAVAPQLYQCLQDCVKRITNGDHDFIAIEDMARKTLMENGFKPDYFTISDSSSLEAANLNSKELVILAAASLGNTRLIDNVTLPLNV